MAGMAHLCSMMSGASAGRFQHWEGESSESLLMCLSSWAGAIHWNTCTRLHVAGASSQHGGCIPRVHSSREKARWGCILFMTKFQKSHGLSSAILLGLWQSRAAPHPRPDRIMGLSVKSMWGGMDPWAWPSFESTVGHTAFD